mmetsp:Transcript_19123/g.51138  ORF Transcript_19123/g.51138 Transcript_19123/m.51138 type:complete len:206 (+) Transcript_19123:41-658(+)
MMLIVVPGFDTSSATVLKSTVVFSYVPAATIFLFSVVFLKVTLPLITTPEANSTGPSTTSLSQPINEGTPWGINVSMASTNLYAPSSLMLGGTPFLAGANSILKSGVRTYASDRSANKSLVVFTGAKRVLGIFRAIAPSKHEIAAPMAVSSCTTFVDFLSLGSTVLPFFITGKGMAPPCFSNVALSATKSTHKLLVLKYVYFETS